MFRATAGGSWPAIPIFDKLLPGFCMTSTLISHNVLMVTRETAADRRYGLGRSLMPVVAFLEQEGWRVRYLCQQDMPESDRQKRLTWLARLARLPGFSGKPGRQLLLSALLERLHMGWFAAQEAKKENFTAVHLHDPWLAAGFWLALKVRRIVGVRWGLTEHGFGCYSHATHEDGLHQGPAAQRWLRRAEAWVLAKAYWVTAPTELALRQVARDLALNRTPPHWVCIPHVCTAMAPVSPASRAAARLKLGWQADDQVVLGIGRLVPLKQFDLLIALCADLLPRHPGLLLQLLGEGDTHHLQKIADSAGFGRRLRFAVVDDVHIYLQAADIYASTSSTESFGLANLEAMTAGLPCVCTAVGGVPEVMGAGAWLLPLEHASLAFALDALLQSPEERQTLAQRARLHAAKKPVLDTVAQAYAAIYTG